MPVNSIILMAVKIPVDNEGYLLEPEDWSFELANSIIASMDINMSDVHWEVVNYVREHYEKTTTVPELRHCLKHLRNRHGKDVATRRYIYQLFPYGYGQQACKIAGMRKPLKLMLDV